MLSNEAYASELRAAILALSSFAADLRDVATVSEHEADGYWRLTLVPDANTACPLDLFLRADRHADLAIGPEIYEDRPIGDLARYLPLVTAIIAGHVVTRRHVAQATGAIVAVETLIKLDGGIWRDHRVTDIGVRLPSVPVSLHDRRYLPYRPTCYRPV